MHFDMLRHTAFAVALRTTDWHPCVRDTSHELNRQAGKRFRVVVLDARPHHEGRALLRHLLAAGLCASYALLNAAAYIFSEVTKVRLKLSSTSSIRVQGQVRPLRARVSVYVRVRPTHGSPYAPSGSCP